MLLFLDFIFYETLPYLADVRPCHFLIFLDPSFSNIRHFLTEYDIFSQVIYEASSVKRRLVVKSMKSIGPCQPAHSAPEDVGRHFSLF